MAEGKDVNENKQPPLVGVVYSGNHVVILQAGNSKPELTEIGTSLDHFLDQGFRLQHTSYENMGAVPAEGSFTFILQFDDLRSEMLEDRRFKRFKAKKGEAE